MQQNRRSFLGILAAAPAAAKAAAEDAAKKMGLAADFDLGAESNLVGNVGHGPPSVDNSWARDRLRDMFSPFHTEQRWEAAKRDARVLDPDLAVLRSMAPAVKHSIQTARSFKRLSRTEKRWYQFELGDLK